MASGKVSTSTWILEHLLEDTHGSCLAREVFAAYQEDCSYKQLEHDTEKQFGRVIHSLLPTIRTSRTNRKGSRQTLYRGVRLALQDLGKASQDTIELCDISKSCPSEWKQTSLHSNEVTMSKDLGYVISKYRLTIDVTIRDTGSVSVHIGSDVVNLCDYGLESTVVLMPENIVTLFKGIDNFRLCFGVLRPRLVQVSTCKVDDWVFPDGHMEKRLRSNSCRRICPMTAMTDSCTACKKIRDYHVNNNLKLVNEDQEDMVTLLDTVFDKASPNQQVLIRDQLKAASLSDNRAMRWNPAVLRMALSIYCRSPKAYEDIKRSGYLRLPSGRLLQYYKNSVSQSPGFNWDNLEWMYHTAKDVCLPAEGYQGGLILDEVTIQEDLQLSRKGDSLQIVGFTDNGVEANALNQARKQSSKQEVANKVQQFIFLGYTGFRFPVGHFPTCGATATDMFIQFWSGVRKLGSMGFTVDYTNIDGGASNRQWLNMHFPNGNAVDCRYTVPNPTDRRKSVLFIMDYSHVIKKIRNSLYSSSTGNKNRDLVLSDGSKILWNMWVEAYQWGLQTSVRVARKISREHIFLDESSKMRNHLAEEVLGPEMLSLFLDFKQSRGQDGNELNGVIELLSYTSDLINIFRDKTPITEVPDHRLSRLEEILAWFKNWEKAAGSPKHLMTSQTREDLDSCIIGFIELAKLRVGLKASVTPSRLNSDVVENLFCQVRSVFGAATNLTHKDYTAALNSIILMQSSVSVSKGSNALAQTNPYAANSSTPLISHSSLNTERSKSTPPKPSLAERKISPLVHHIPKPDPDGRNLGEEYSQVHSKQQRGHKRLIGQGTLGNDPKAVKI